MKEIRSEEYAVKFVRGFTLLVSAGCYAHEYSPLMNNGFRSEHESKNQGFNKR